jgi:tetratricopeptide (TPR) repeat protein
MKKLLLLFMMVLFSCHEVFISGKTGIEKSLAKNPASSGKPVNRHSSGMTGEEISIYMGYQASILAGDVSTAKDLINKLMEKHPDFIDPYIDLANIHIYKKDLDEAADVIKKAQAIDNENVSVLLALANIHIMKSQQKSAVPILEKVIKLSPEKESVYLVLANIYYQEKDYISAKEVLEKFLSKRSDNFLGLMYLAKVYESLNMNKEAVVYYERAFKEREEDEVLLNLDGLYDKLGDRNKSIEVLEKFLLNNQDFPKVRERLALLYLGENNYQKSAAHFDVLLNQFPDNMELKYKAVYVAIDGGFLDKAKSYLGDIIQKNPDSQKGLYFMGLLYKELKDWGIAASYFERVTDEEYLKSSRLYLTVCYNKLGKKAKSFKILKDFWDKDRDEEVGYFLASYYKGTKDYENALIVLEEILKIPDLKNNKAVYLAAEIYLKKGAVEKGISMVEGILKKNQDDPEALNFIGYSYAERGLNLDMSEKMLKKALEFKPGDPYIMDSIAWMYYMKKDYEKALEWQGQAVERLKNEPTLLEHMGDILKAQGKNKDAKKYYLDASKHEPEEPELLRNKIEELKDF